MKTSCCQSGRRKGGRAGWRLNSIFPHPLLKYVRMHYTQLGPIFTVFAIWRAVCHVCSYLDRGLKNEDRQQTNKTRHTNYVTEEECVWIIRNGQWDTLKLCTKKCFSPAATAGGHPVCQLNLTQTKRNEKCPVRDIKWWYRLFLFSKPVYEQAKGVVNVFVWGFTVVTRSTLIISNIYCVETLSMALYAYFNSKQDDRKVRTHSPQLRTTAVTSTSVFLPI